MRAAQSIWGMLWVLAVCTAAKAAPEGRFGWLGLAPAEAGQTLQQAEAALGAPLLPVAPAAKDAARCHLRSAASQPGVSYVVDQGLVTRADAGPGVRALGAQLGDSVDAVISLYPDITRRDSDGVMSGTYLVLTDPDGRHAVVMQAAGDTILAIRAGLSRAVESPQGCP